MNSASQVSQAPEVSEPERIMTQDEHYQQWMRENHPDVRAQGHYGDLWYKIIKALGAPHTWEYEGGNFYQNYLDNINNKNERKAVQSAQAWDEYMSNTAYSRAFKDIESMGVNPYLLLNSGSTPSTTVGSSSKPSYSSSKPANKDSSTSGKGRDLALIVLAIAKIASLLAA